VPCPMDDSFVELSLLRCFMGRSAVVQKQPYSYTRLLSRQERPFRHKVKIDPSVRWNDGLWVPWILWTAAL